MSEMTGYEPGVFCWVDYVAHDMQAGMKWYGDLFGWDVKVEDTQGGPPYAQMLKDGKVVAGMGQMSDEMKAQGVPPMWNNYVSVADATAAADRAQKLGAQIVVPPMQVMDAGWLAFFLDPTGANVAVWQPGTHFGAQLVNEPGALSWNELMTRDVEKAKGFYGELFGWTFDTQDMGDRLYTTIKVGERMNGGIMEMPADVPEQVPAHWSTYFSVEDADATAAAATKSGGAIVVPPMDIPGVGRFAVIRDPQGGHFTAIALTNPG